MAVSTTQSDYEAKCVIVPMILSEGTITCAARGYSSRGLYETVCTFASELQKGDPIAYAYGETMTYDNSSGLGAVTRVSNAAGYKGRGRIVDEPRWIGAPPSTAGTYPNFKTNISNKRVRIASVELWGVQKVLSVKHTTNNAGAFTLGRAGYAAVSAASSYSAHTVCLEDTANAQDGNCLIHLTYRAQAAAGTAYTELIGAPSGLEIMVVT
jgi:hypothetical protein